MEVSVVLDIALFCVLLTNIFVCPYTKVEESFNIQAMHDILYHGFNISQYDHTIFPGVVPRTFLGPLIISILSSPLVAIVNFLGLPKIFSQYIVRCTLGCSSLLAFKLFCHGVTQKFGQTVGHFLVIITLTQFHFIFYISRPLPNTFALILAMVAFYFWLTGHQASFIWCSAYSIIIFRAELALLMGIIIIYELYHQRISFLNAFVHSASAGITSVVLTLLIDSYFWQRVCWPEAEVLWFNTVLNKSSNWGTSPFLWYFFSALPRALSVFTPILIIYGLRYDKRTRIISILPMIFVLLFSFLPHKELRFIFYVIPLLNITAAVGVNYIYQNFHKWKVETQALYSTLVFGGLLSNIVFSNILLYASSLNYPGGVAFAKLHQELTNTDNKVQIHICNYAAQTGVTRFGELNGAWSYNKTEHLEGKEELGLFSHLLVEAPCNNTILKTTHELLVEIEGLQRILPRIRKEFPYLSFLEKAPRLCILKKKSHKRISV